ncbi:MAG: AraC family transcriptional regulator [Phycisphaeraceae bacterium]
MAIQRRASLRSRSPARRVMPVYAMGLANVRPVIRIAHQVNAPCRIAPRIIFDHEFVLFLEGRGEIHLGRRAVAFGLFDLWFFRPFVPHAIVSDEGAGGSHIAVHFDFSPDVPPIQQSRRQRRPYRVRLPAGVLPATHCSLHADHAIVGAFRQLLRVWDRPRNDSRNDSRNQPGDIGRLEASASLMQIIAMLARLRHDDRDDADAVSAANRQRLERAITYARGHLHAPLNLDDLAQAAGLSASHTARLFHHVTGCPPMQFIRRLRIERARELLGEVDLSIKQVAARTGFASPYLFSRVFRRIDGLSPSQFRQALLAGRDGAP